MHRCDIVKFATLLLLSPTLMMPHVRSSMCYQNDLIKLPLADTIDIIFIWGFHPSESHSICFFKNFCPSKVNSMWILTNPYKSLDSHATHLQYPLSVCKKGGVVCHPSPASPCQLYSDAGPLTGIPAHSSPEMWRHSRSVRMNLYYGSFKGWE